MGFIEIASGKQTEVISGLWKNYVDLRTIEQADSCVKAEEELFNGSRIILGEGQSFVLFSGDKFVDGITGLGAFVYHDSFECGRYVPETKEFAEIIRSAQPDAFTDIPNRLEQNGYCIQRKAGERITFTFDAAAYHDSTLGFDLVLQGKGYFEIQTANMLTVYAGAGFSKERFLAQMEPVFSEEEKKLLSEEFETAFEKVLIHLRESDISYQQIPYRSEKVLGMIKKELKAVWEVKRGITACSMDFISIYPDEAGTLALVKYYKENGRPKEEPHKKPEERVQPQKEETVKQTRQEEQPQQAWTEQRVNEPQPEDVQDAEYRQIAGNSQMERFSYDSQKGLGAEVVLKKGVCNWIKKPLLILNGNAVLTNQRFSYKKGMLNFVEGLVANKFVGNGENSFEFHLSELVGIGEGVQGLTKTIVFYLRDGRSYHCFVYDKENWLAQFYMLTK